MLMRSYILMVRAGQKHGFLPSVVKVLLHIVSIMYGFLHTSRKGLYQIGFFRSTSLPVPVISVGNLTMGGTGKTPIVEMFARKIAKKGLTTAILARGYGKIDPAHDDENLLFDIDHVVRLTGADRVKSAKLALEEYRAQTIILDDGFQHFRIERDLDILVVDCLDPFGGDQLLPRGGLRESPSQAERADLVILTRTDQVDKTTLHNLKSRLTDLSQGKPIVETVHQPTHLRSLGNKQKQDLEWLRGKKINAFCGLGNPEGFRKTLEALGADICLFRAFPDHHPYTRTDIERLNLEAQEFMADFLVTTEKDSLKLHQEGIEKPVYILRIDIEVTRGEDHLERALTKSVTSSDSSRAGIIPES